jgi:hypothetical protein
MLLVSDHPGCAAFSSFATFSYWRSHPSSVRRGLFAYSTYPPL